MMQFQVTQIDFDFEDDNFECPINEQIEIIDDTKSTIWEVDDEDDLSKARKLWDNLIEN